MYDALIIGGGPAGLNAALYTTRYGLECIVFAELIGGLMSEATDVQNYIGFESVTGLELTEKFKKHAERYGAKVVYDRISEIKKNGNHFVATDGNKAYEGKTVLLATGTKHRKLDIPGEKEFAGKGVVYCATCEGFFYKGKVICIVGGGDSAFTAAVYMAKIAERVYLIHRSKKFRAENVWVEAAKKMPNIEMILDNEVREIKGGKNVEEAILKNTYKDKGSLSVDGVFIEIGSIPDAGLARQLGVGLDERDYITVKPDQSTNIEGVFAAGEATSASNHYNQIVTAAAEGAIAAHSISQYLQKQ